eukprot:9818895-Lingulodinium_polyedra.AAC.1
MSPPGSSKRAQADHSHGSASERRAISQRRLRPCASSVARENRGLEGPAAARRAKGRPRS